MKRIKEFLSSLITRLPGWFRSGSFIMGMGILSVLLLTWMYMVLVLPVIQDGSARIAAKKHPVQQTAEPDTAAFRMEINRLTSRLTRTVTKNAYLVINTTENIFYLYKNENLILEGNCSTGSYIELVKDEENKWVFRTPKGLFRIQGKIVDPVWRRPDWAFVEEGLPIPSSTHSTRYEYGVLGDYALSLGDGYLIHGTLYQRLLGMPVTHGCVRLNDDDLESVFKTLQVGSKVIIY